MEATNSNTIPQPFGGTYLGPHPGTLSFGEFRKTYGKKHGNKADRAFFDLKRWEKAKSALAAE